MAIKALTQQQFDDFWRDGFLVVENAVTPDLLQKLQQTFKSWVLESCAHTEPYGTTVNDQPRFDLEESHRCESRHYAGLMRRLKSRKPIMRRWH